MGKRKHTVDEVVKSLLKKRSVIRINKENKTIEIDQLVSDLGNSSWGKIDFLVNHNNYSLLRQ